MGRRNRRSTIDLTECVCYHVISRCTRQLHLFGGTDDERGARKEVLMRHLERVATASAVGVAGWSVMDNHLHLVLKVDSQVAQSWSDREVARRWLVLHPPRDGYRRKVAVEARHIDAVLNAAPEGVANARRVLVDGLREKLCSISHFMKELKQEVTQDLNRLDETVGSVWAGRFKCQRIVESRWTDHCERNHGGQTTAKRLLSFSRRRSCSCLGFMPWVVVTAAVRSI